MTGQLLRVRDLRLWFRSPDGPVRAVDGIDLDIDAGRCVALVGESGSGKSAVARSLLGLHPPGAIALHDGSIRFEGEELLGAEDATWREVRGNRIGMVLQDPNAALNPVKRIGAQLDLVLRRHLPLGRRERRERAISLLEQVGIPEPDRRLRSFPGELSGGMRQRVVMASALAADPVLLIADEPTTALDVTVQAAVLELIDELRRDRGLGVLLITHDLGVVAERADEMATMYAGRVVERTSVHDGLRRPHHPYTAALLRSVPARAIEDGRPLAPIPGRPPSLVGDRPGCAFAPRCERAAGRCATTDVRLRPIEPTGRLAACLHPHLDEVAP